MSEDLQEKIKRLMEDMKKTKKEISETNKDGITKEKELTSSKSTVPTLTGSPEPTKENISYNNVVKPKEKIVVPIKSLDYLIRSKYYGKRKSRIEEAGINPDLLVGPKLYPDLLVQGIQTNVIIPITTYELYNSLYSNYGLKINVDGKTESIESFPIAVVEIYKRMNNPNKLYVLIPQHYILMMKDKKFKTMYNKIDSIVKNFVTTKYSDTKNYSDSIRMLAFQSAYEYVIDLFNSGKLKLPGITKPYLKKWLPLIIDNSIREIADFGFGEIEYFFYDDQVEDIFINGYETYVILQTRDFFYVETNVFITKDKLNRFKEAIATLYGRQFTETLPVIDIQIPGYFNIRVNMTYWSETGGFSVDGYSVTLRKSRETPPPISVLLHPKYRSINEEVGALLVEFLHRNIGSLIYGETGSGKTTLLKSLLMTVPQHYRIVSLEDTVELPDMRKWNYHHVRLSARSPTSVMSEKDWTMDKGVLNLLRMRPYIAVLGEVRGKEAKVLAEMAQMGLATVYSTMHAKDHFKLLNRLVHHMGVEPSAVTSFDTLTLLQTIRPRGLDTIIRRLTSIAYIEDVYNVEEENSGVKGRLTLSSGDESVNVEIVPIVEYNYQVDPVTGKLNEKWTIDWDNLIKSRIIRNIHTKFGMPYEIIFLEIVEKYNLLRELSKNVVVNDFDTELKRVVKLFNMYNILNSEGWIGEELWDELIKEIKYHYDYEIKTKWDPWILKKISVDDLSSLD